jgi:hypothetical protein
LPFQITNTSNGPVLIRLRSGATLHLVSGEESPELEDPEVRKNPRLERLLERHLITVREMPPSQGEKTSGATGAARSRGRPRQPRSSQGDDQGTTDEHGS